MPISGFIFNFNSVSYMWVVVWGCEHYMNDCSINLGTCQQPSQYLSTKSRGDLSIRNKLVVRSKEITWWLALNDNLMHFIRYLYFIYWKIDKVAVHQKKKKLLFTWTICFICKCIEVLRKSSPESLIRLTINDDRLWDRCSARKFIYYFIVFLFLEGITWHSDHVSH